MARRRTTSSSARSGRSATPPRPPAWLSACIVEDWADLTEPPPPWVDRADVVSFYMLTAWRRWKQACGEWRRENGLSARELAELAPMSAPRWRDPAVAGRLASTD